MIMSKFRPALAFLLFLSASPAPAAQEEAADAGQPGQDLIKNVDSWLGRMNEKLRSDEPVESGDFDSLFGESFFSDTEDPLENIELAREKLEPKLGPKRKDFDKWVDGKLSPADLKPEVVPGERHITVKFTLPPGCGPVKVKMDPRRIKLYFAGGKKGGPKKRSQRVMPVPEGADPDKYRVKSGKGTLSIIFSRRKGSEHMEASK